MKFHQHMPEEAISGLTLEAGCSEVNRTEVKEELLRRINAFKLTQFELFRAKTTVQTVRGLAATANPVQLELG